MREFLKKSLAVFSATLTAGLLLTTPLSSSAATLRNGDTNGDGKVDVYDAINISKHILGKKTLTGTNLTQSDYNKDGTVNIYDVIFVSRRILCESKINEVVALINLNRTKNGVDKLTIDQDLVDAAMKRASELPKKFSADYRPDGSIYPTILDEYNIEYTKPDSTVSAVPATAKELYTALFDRSDIKSRLLKSDYTKIGVGYCSSNDVYKHYWSILLID